MWHAIITTAWIFHVTLLVGGEQAAAVTSNDGKYDHLIQFPLMSAQDVRRRKLQETPEEEEGHPQMVDALYQGYGEHYVDLWCGSPPQRQTVILNTGAKGTAFPCSRCSDDCGLDYHTDSYYDESKSLNFHELTCDECVLGSCAQSAISKCEFGMAYVEGSAWVAIESRDHCYIGGIHDKPVSIDDCTRSDCDDLDPEHAPGLAFDLTFGCQTQISGFFQTQLADGILGMNNSPQSFWHQMYDAGKITDRLFSLCYTRKDSALKNGTDAGAMTLGGSDDRLHLSPMVFTKQEDEWGEDFGVLLRKIHIRQGGGGDSVNATKPNLNMTTLKITTEELNHGYIIIESGTTDTYLTSQLVMPFAEAWQEIAGTEYGHHAMSFTYEQVQELPTILYQFQGAEELNREVGEPKDVVNLAGDLDPEHPYDVVVAMPPNHYMQYDAATRAYSARLYFNEPRGMSTLGANTLMGHDVLFDVENRRIGWAESRCDYRHLVEKAGFDVDGDNLPDVPDPPPSPDPPIPNVPTPAAPTPDKPNYEPVAPGSNNEPVAPTSEDSSALAAPTSGYTPTSESADDGGGMCSSFGCHSFWFLIIFVAVPLVVVRQGRFGAWTERVRRLTGGSDYRTMSNAWEGGYSAQQELELQESGTQML